MNLAEKIVLQRKKMGLSQEQLADQLGITRQSVSKWEAGTSTPELGKIVAMSELFQVSVDYLVKDYLEEDVAWKNINAGTGDARWEEDEATRRLEEKVDRLTRYVKGYQYTSKTKIAGIPLVSIRLSRRLGKDSVAKGIIAIGNVAIGVISLGAFSVGIFSFGAIAAGILAVGAMALGAAAWGALAIGILAVGSGAVGIYSVGVAAYGHEIASGVAAQGKTVIGETVKGTNCLIWREGITGEEIRHFLLQYHPGLWKPIREIITFFTVHIG